MSKRFPGRRLSPVRLSLLLIAVAALTTGAVFSVNSWQDGQVADRNNPWFAAYVDATATPVHAFENPASRADRQVVLGFVVAAGPQECVATWGGYHALSEAQDAIDLDRRIARLVQAGGDVVVSFGGQANSELALACASADDLADQYRTVIDRYQPAAIDFDIEGPALADEPSRTRRAEALAQLQQEQTTRLPVWLTLPVGADGLTADGVATVRAFLDAGVDLAGVNAMTMNYGSAAPQDLAETAISSLRGLHRQLIAIHADRGQRIGEKTAWRMVGATPMIGQNDVVAEVFTMDAARRLNAFALEVQLGRMSMWSANRDRTCAPAYLDLSVVSDACSGVEQAGERFSEVLGAGFSGSAHGLASTPGAAPTVRPEDVADDPATSPYPIWNAEASYPTGTRVVWRRNVYVAKWWTTDGQPDDPTVLPADSPWRLVGPVLPGETPRPQLQLPADFYPAWEPTTIYERGQRVMLEGVAFEAKWWSQGDNPVSGQADPGASPWRTLTEDEIEKLLAGR